MISLSALHASLIHSCDTGQHMLVIYLFSIQFNYVTICYNSTQFNSPANSEGTVQFNSQTNEKLN